MDQGSCHTVAGSCSASSVLQPPMRRGLCDSDTDTCLHKHKEEDGFQAIVVEMHQEPVGSGGEDGTGAF